MAARYPTLLLATALLAAAWASGCVVAGTGDDAAEEPIALYEDDDPLLGGKADGTGLAPIHRIADYQATVETRVLQADLEGSDLLQSILLEAGARVVVLRSLAFDGEPSHIVVSDETFELALVSSDGLAAASRTATAEERASTRYGQALEQTRAGVLCELHSAAAGAPEAQRFALTIDMCQSRRQWEQGLFDWLVALSDSLGQPVKVGIAMTGLWANRHPERFRQLVAWQQAGQLDITWVNHSFYHQLSQDADGDYHFLTDESVDFDAGVLELEQLLLEQGVMFSPLFRFPGLTHDERTLRRLAELGLFPLDANGWLAKGEPLGDRSVVLLHGNGNEPPGTELFLDWAQAHRSDLHDGRAELVDALETLPLGAPVSLPPASFRACAP